jgi:membrane associated rhomboid family serine protease
VSPLGNVSISFIVPSRMLFIMWLIFFIEFNYGIDLSMFSLLPRVGLGLLGVITAPLLHGNLVHLMSNTLPLLVLGVALYFFYGRIGRLVFLYSYFVPSLLVWIFGRPVFHLGASGLIYSIAFFLFVSGIVRREVKSLIIGIVTAVIYGGLVWGILPTSEAVSWEYHTAGTIVGVSLAIVFRNRKIK